jgi:hypothetical protein
MEDGVKLFVIILKRHPMLKFVAAFGLRKETEEIDRLRLLNTLNDKLIVARFAMPEPETITADQYLPYHGGLLPQQLVKALRLFVQCAVGGIREYDSAGLVGQLGWSRRKCGMGTWVNSIQVPGPEPVDWQSEWRRKC